MQIEIISFGIAILLLVFLISMSVYIIFLSVSWLYGAPYVPINDHELVYILKTVSMKSGRIFVDLGCGDGRVLRTAAEMYKVRGIGYDVNPIVLALARFRGRGMQNLTYFKKDIRQADLHDADYVFLFLFPKIINQLKNTFLHETKSHVVFISHAFRIPYLDGWAETILEGKTFKTYIYTKKK